MVRHFVGALDIILPIDILNSMKEELEHWWNHINDATGDHQRKLFVHYCLRLVVLQEEGKLSEEQAAYKMVNALRFRNISDSPECDAILDIAGTVEIPRTTSYAQCIGSWDAKTADYIKREEWKELIIAIENAKTAFKMK